MIRPFRTARWLVLWLMVSAVFGPPSARAQVSDRERLVYRFDFEERERGNYEDLPMHWFPIGRPRKAQDAAFNRIPVHQELMREPGFPVYTEVRFDDRVRTSGKNSFYLGLNGGSAGAFLEVGTVPTVPNSDYLITASVRTTPLKHARAKFIAYLVDEKGRRIDASVVASEPLNTDGSWVSSSIKLRGEFSRAAWIGLELQLSQPRPDPDSPLGKHQIVYQDVNGGAWFDDISIWQLPRVVLETQSPTNIIRAPEKPKLSLQVRDLTGRALEARLRVVDHLYREVAGSQQAVGNGAPSVWRWAPNLPGFGWYLAEMSVRDPTEKGEAGYVAQARSAFLWLDDDTILHAADASRFALAAEGVDDDELELLPALFDRVRLDAAVVSMWARDSALQNLDQRERLLDRFLQTMLVRGRDVTMSFAPAPADVARTLDVDRDSPLPLFGKTPSSWINYVSPIMLRHGQRVQRWQLGSTRQADAFFLPELPDLLTSARREFQALTPSPQLVVPWRLDQARRSDVAGVAYAIEVPTAVRPEQFAAHLEEWKAAPAAAYRLHLREPSALELRHDKRVEDLVERMLYAWECGAGAMVLDRPWTIATEPRTSLLPDPLLGSFAATAHRLAGRKVVGRLPVGDGIECMILDGPRGGALAAWNRSAPASDAVIDMYLGVSPEAVDVWGNRTALPLVEGRHRWALSSTPVFFEGIDAALALFRSAFKMTNPFIESTQTIHDRKVTITNPWPRTISGHMLVVQPDNWRIEPRRNAFSIAAGQSLTLPLQITFPVAEVAGRKKLVARFDFNADQHYTVDVSTAMEVGLRDIDFDANLSLERNAAGGADAVVTQIVTNTGAEPLSLYAFSHMPGHPRQERLISRLKPGQTIIRRFRFPNIAASAATIRVGLRETAGPSVLNKTLTLGPR